MRLTRTKFAIGYVLTGGIANVIISAITSVITSNKASGAGVLLIVVAAIAIAIAIQIYLAVGRLKDMNANPWWATLVILPVVGLIFMFPKGTKGANQYGEDPREQNR